jgi:hypothetical protein
VVVYAGLIVIALYMLRRLARTPPEVEDDIQVLP